MSITSWVFWQVSGTGIATVLKTGVQVTAGGVSIPTGSLSVTAGGLAVTDNTIVNAGIVSITATNTAATVLDVYASAAGFTGNAIRAHLAAGAFTANALQLSEGGNVVFQVLFEGYTLSMMYYIC